MSRSIYIIDLLALDLPEPDSIEEFMGMIQPWLRKSAPHNPRFVAMAERVVAKFPDPEVGDREWIDSLVDDAREGNRAVWHLGLPTRDTMSVVAELVRQGTETGLSLYDDQLGLGFLPGGQVIPPEREEEWELFLQALDEQEPRPTLKQMRRKMRLLFGQHLVPHGFAFSDYTNEDIRYHSDIDEFAYYRRQHPEGWQWIRVEVRHLYGRYSCDVRISGMCKQVNDILEAATDTALSRNYAFREYQTTSPGYAPFNDIESDEKIAAGFAFVENKVMPLLDRMRTLEGLNWACNHPDAFDTVGKHLRQGLYSSLVCAWLLRDPAWDERVEWFSQRAVQLAEGNPLNSHHPAKLQRLLTYLREQVKPLR